MISDDSDYEEAPRRLCWWRDPENGAFDGLRPDLQSNPEARYLYEYAQAEKQAKENFAGLESVPWDTNDPLIRLRLTDIVRENVALKLMAYADRLLDLWTPPTEAAKIFDSRVEELLAETLDSKWRSYCRALDIEYNDDVYWRSARGAAAQIKREFEEILWGSVLDDLMDNDDPQPAERTYAEESGVSLSDALRHSDQHGLISERKALLGFSRTFGAGRIDTVDNVAVWKQLQF